MYLLVRFRTQIINEADDRRKEADNVHRAQASEREKEQFIEDKLFRATELLDSVAVSTERARVYALVDFVDFIRESIERRLLKNIRRHDLAI